MNYWSNSVPLISLGHLGNLIGYTNYWASGQHLSWWCFCWIISKEDDTEDEKVIRRKAALDKLENASEDTLLSQVAGNLQKCHICYVFRWWSSGHVLGSV